MRRYTAHPYGSSISASRVLSLLLLLGVIGMLYSSLRQPVNWKWLTEEPQNQAPVDTNVVAIPANEMLYPGPTNADHEERTSFEARIRSISDRTALRAPEMLAYWQLMSWSCAQLSSEMNARSVQEPAVSQLWEKPADFRGNLITLNLHIRRVLRYDAPKNPLGLTEVYEVWGWTDLSRSFPYVVVVPELPAGISVGNEVEAEATFTGYFLKIMAYAAYDKNRGAPLLIGRLHSARVVSAITRAENSQTDYVLYFVIGAMSLFGLGYVIMQMRKTPRRPHVIPESNSPLPWPGLSNETSTITNIEFPMTGPLNPDHPSQSNSS